MSVSSEGVELLEGVLSPRYSARIHARRASLPLTRITESRASAGRVVTVFSLGINNHVPRVLT